MPRLREDLKLLPGPPTAEGQPSWTLYDPARHRFLRIGWLEFEILGRWHLGTPEAIARAIRQETTLADASAKDVLEFTSFAAMAGMLAALGQAGFDRLKAEDRSQKSTASQWLIKNYIFFRIRLFNPDKLLTFLHDRLSWLFTRRFLAVMAALALLGFGLILRQWEHYTHSFISLFTLEGAFEVGLALSFAKVIHEFGHGLMTKHFGCRVPGMGVAFVVMWPVLWTDTTDAWRLNNRRERVAIDAAGMLAEILLAIAASLAWSLLPDGPARTAAFLLSSSTWLLTVAVNVNPLMRFDGYYLLSDALDIPNLQDRAFALCRWWLRRALFGEIRPVPEKFPPFERMVLLAYGFCCWVYRFLLFMGIAFLVYHLAFKALGLVLMAVEIWWFIALPILNELRAWLMHTKETRWNRATIRTAAIAGLLLLGFLAPWHSHVSAPALLRAQRQATLYTAEPGQLTEILPNGAKVKQGDTLAALASPDIDYRVKRSGAEVSGFKAQLAGQAFDPEGVSDLKASWSEFDETLARQREVTAEDLKLSVHAPFAGVLTDVPENLKIGAWLPRREMLGILIDPSGELVEAYVNEADLARIHVNDKTIFLPENGEASVPLHIAEISAASARELQVPELASVQGGGIAVRKEQNGELVPETAVYRVLLAPDGPVTPVLRRQRGTVEIAGTRISFAERLYQHIAALLIRETGL